MKKAAKLLSMLLTIIMLATALGACSKAPASSDEKPTGEATDKPVEKKKVVFWTHQRHDMDYVKSEVEKFNAANPDIEVEMTVHTDDYTNVLNLAYQNDQAPDIHTGGPPLKDMVDMGRYDALDSYLSDALKAKVQPYLVEGNNMLDGKIYTLPFVGNNFRLVINKDLFKAAGLDPANPPKTYAEVIDAAKKITEYGKTQEPKKYGFCLPTAETWIWWQYADQLSRVAGEQFFDYKDLSYHYSVQKPVLEFYLQMQKDGTLFPGGLQLKNDPARAQFSEGNIGMMIAATWDVGVFVDQFPAKIDWDVTPLPTPDGTQKGKGEFSGGGYLNLNSKSKVKKEAMKFFEFLLQDENITGYYEQAKGLPIYPEIAKNAKNQPAKKGFAGFADTSLDALYPPGPPGITQEGDDRGTVYNNIMAGKVGLDEGLTDLDKRMNAAVKAAIDEGKFDPEVYKRPNFDPMNPTGK